MIHLGSSQTLTKLARLSLFSHIHNVENSVFHYPRATVYFFCVVFYIVLLAIITAYALLFSVYCEAHLNRESSLICISRLILSLAYSHVHSQHSVVFGSVAFSSSWTIHLFSRLSFSIWAKRPRVFQAWVSLTYSSLCLWTCADISHLMQNRIYLSLLRMWNPPFNRIYFKNCVRRDNFTGNPVKIQFVNMDD